MKELTLRQLPYNNQRLYWRFLKAIFSSYFFYVLQKLYKEKTFFKGLKE